MGLLREYRQHQKAERFKVGSEWVRRVEIENGKTVDNDLLFTRWNVRQKCDKFRKTVLFCSMLSILDALAY